MQNAIFGGNSEPGDQIDFSSDFKFQYKEDGNDLKLTKGAWQIIDSGDEYFLEMKWDPKDKSSLLLEVSDEMDVKDV